MGCKVFGQALMESCEDRVQSRTSGHDSDEPGGGEKKEGEGDGGGED